MIDEKKLLADFEAWEKQLLQNADPYMGEVVETLIGVVINKIRNQPKVGEWIPVSERLPEEPETSAFAEVVLNDFMKKGEQ